MPLTLIKTVDISNHARCFHTMGINMSKPTVQHIPRKLRLSNKDLTRLIQTKLSGVTVDYRFGEGWYVFKGEKPVSFIGKNWVEAHEYVHNMPSNKSVIHKIFDKLKDLL